MSACLCVCDNANAGLATLTSELLVLFLPFSWHLLQECVLHRRACCYVSSFLNGKDVHHYVLLTLLKAERTYIRQRERHRLINILTFSTSEVFSVTTVGRAAVCTDYTDLHYGDKHFFMLRLQDGTAMGSGLVGTQ